MAQDFYSLFEDVKKPKSSSLESEVVDQNTDWNEEAQRAWNQNEDEKNQKRISAISPLVDGLNSINAPAEQTASPAIGITPTPVNSVDDTARFNYGMKTPIDVEGKKDIPPTQEKQMPLNTPAPQQASGVPQRGTANTDPEFGQMAAMAAPYVLEAVLGGGKYMGSAGAGSAAGASYFERQQKAQADREARDRALKAKMDMFTEGLNQKGLIAGGKQAVAEKSAVIKEKVADQANYFAKTTVNPMTGKPEVSLYDKKTGAPIHTGDQAYVTPPSQGSDRAARSDEYATRELSKRYEKVAPSLANAQEYMENYRDLKSFAPEYVKTPDTNLPRNLMEERQAVRRFISAYIKDNAGTAQGQHEIAQVMSGAGIAITPKTIAELKDNPAMMADRIVGTSNQAAIRKALDSLADIQFRKQKIIDAGYKPEITKSFKSNAGVKDVAVTPYAAKTPAPQATTGGSLVSERIKKLKEMRGR